MAFNRKWYIMAAVAMGTFLATIDGSIVNIALPTLQAELQTSFSIVQWVVLAYLLTVTTLMLSIGRLADMIGKKYLYLAGLVVFTTGSILCGLSTSIYELIGFRVVQGLGAAMIMALGTAIITEAFPPAERGRALGVSGLTVSLGIIAGPTFGGLILQSLSWHWIFFVNLPVGIIGTFMVFRLVPVTTPPGGQNFDFPGAVTLFISVFSFLVALTIGQNTGFTQLPVLLLFSAFVIFMGLFISIEKRSKQPMVDLRLFQNDLFSINLITGFLSFVCAAGLSLLMPFYLEGVLLFDPRTTGLLLGVLPLAVGIIAPISGALSDRFGSRPLAAIGLAIVFIGYLSISTLNGQTTALGYALRYLPIGIGMGFFQSPNNSAIMGAAPRDRLGVASGLLAITRTIGQTTGIAILGAIWASQILRQGGTAAVNGTIIASPAVQVNALQTTIDVALFVILVAAFLSVWALWQERKRNRLKTVSFTTGTVLEDPKDS